MHLLQVVAELEFKGVRIQSLREQIDPSTQAGRAFVSIIGAISQMERELKAERTSAGRAAAKARGRTGGRPRTDEAKLEKARILSEHSNESIGKICASLGIGRRTFYDYLARVKEAGTSAQ
jgi:DNA invertase Pin-like site-specific DNA recombinase